MYDSILVLRWISKFACWLWFECSSVGLAGGDHNAIEKRKVCAALSSHSCKDGSGTSAHALADFFTRSVRTVVKSQFKESICLVRLL